MFEEFEEYVKETRVGVQHMLEWAKQHGNDDIFQDESGKKLLKDICECARYQAYLWFDMAEIELHDMNKQNIEA